MCKCLRVLLDYILISVCVGECLNYVCYCVRSRYIDQENVTYIVSESAVHFTMIQFRLSR